MKRIAVVIANLLTISSFAQNGEVKRIVEAINQQQYDMCLQLAEKAVMNNSKLAGLYYYKAVCEREKGLYTAAVGSATRALALLTDADSLYPRTLLLRSLAYANIGKLDSAILDNEILTQRFPGNVNYQLNMSYLYGENQQFDDCIRVLENARNFDSSNLHIISNLAYYSGEAKSYAKATRYAELGLKMAKDSVDIASLLNSLGFAQAKTISAEKGISTIRKSISYRASNPYAYFNMALIYLEEKRIPEACANFKKAKAVGGVNLTAEYLKAYCE